TSSAVPATPTAQPRPTRTSAPTETPLPQPTPMGGGQGQIAFASDRSGKNQIYITGASDSEDEVFQVTDMLEGACQPSWAPDGQRIVFTSPCEGNLKSYPNSGLFVINADGTNLMPLLNQSGGDFDPAWSPDGKYVAFTSLRNFGRPQIFVYSFEDNTAEGISATYSWNSQPAWSADSKKLAYVNSLNGRDVIWTMDLDGENKEMFSRNNYQINNAPSWAPDGTAILYTQLAADLGVPKLVGAAFPWDSSAGEYRKSPSQLPMREGVYSPDGFWVAFEGWPKGANHDIYLIASNGAGLIRVTTHERLDFDPAWRPVVPPS
ncbi:MAG TPA: hypothetical protein VLS48_05630, partial [Anaerolineales bacterium]|nr:hypothetical protein [Anaerolineales bacterium]